MSNTESVEKSRQCIESAKRGLDWLLRQLGPDGGWRPLPQAPVDAYYKTGAALALMGEATAVEIVFDYVKRNFLQPDGDFLPREHAWHNEIHYQYANGWFIIGAQKQGRYDISVPAVEFLLSQQDPDHGGFYSLKSLAGAKKRSDTMSTGIAGVAWSRAAFHLFFQFCAASRVLE